MLCGYNVSIAIEKEWALPVIRSPATPSGIQKKLEALYPGDDEGNRAQVLLLSYAGKLNFLDFRSNSFPLEECIIHSFPKELAAPSPSEEGAKKIFYKSKVIIPDDNCNIPYLIIPYNYF